jgi:hypothetical protein
MDNLYETDIMLWSEHQAELLRRLAAGEQLNEPLDWANIIEEIESVGREQRHAVESLLVQALTHILKAAAWPDSDAVPHWQAEARAFRAQAKRRYVASMRNRIDLPSLYADALKGMPTTIDGAPPLPVPTACPLTLEELLTP